MEAEITIEYDDSRIAEAVAKAVYPDNSGTLSGLSVKTLRVKRKVITRIECKKGFSTFVATIDDLLFCITTAENALRETTNLRSTQSRV